MSKQYIEDQIEKQELAKLDQANKEVIGILEDTPVLAMANIEIKPVTFGPDELMFLSGLYQRSLHKDELISRRDNQIIHLEQQTDIRIKKIERQERQIKARDKKIQSLNKLIDELEEEVNERE